MRNLDDLRLANRPGVPLMWGTSPVAADFAVVSPKIGFPYILDQLVVQIGANGIRCGLQLYIADEDDITDIDALTGDPLWTSTLDLQAGEPRIPMFHYVGPLLFEPARRVNRAPTFLKARWRQPLGGTPTACLAHLVPLGPDD